MSLKRGMSLKTTRKKPASLCLSCKKRKFKTDSIIMESYQKPVAWKKRLGLQTKFPGDKVPRTLLNGLPIDGFCIMPLSQIVTERERETGKEMGKGLIVLNRPMEALKTKE